jgi:hydrogenase maturation protease
MIRTLIIGYGNPLRGDDAIGHYAAERLNDVLAGMPVDVETCHQLTPELAERVGSYDRVIFVDASVGDVPGIVRTMRIDPSTIETHPISHHFAPEAVICCCEQLYGDAPDAWLVTMTSNSFGYMEDLSEPVRTGMADLIDAIITIVKKEVPVPD